MSTYYGFHCDKCKVTGGFLSSQAWGVGNFDIIDTFKFVMHHALECGQQNIGMHSEHDDAYEEWPTVHLSGPDREKFLEDSKAIFPSSNDWQFIAEHIAKDRPWDQTKTEWLEKEQKRAKEPRDA
jgi:hypothetical protein